MGKDDSHPQASVTGFIVTAVLQYYHMVQTTHLLLFITDVTRIHQHLI